jgi:3-oxoacyl-[acyl-carrier protein] reductase
MTELSEPTAGDSPARVALVTGGGRGIGRAIALALARSGAHVAVNFRRDEVSAIEVVREIEAIGGCARPYRASVDDFAALEQMVPGIEQDLGPISILVNNAGQSTKAETVETASVDSVEATLREHALGPLRLCQLVLPSMRREARGDVIMISSSAPQLFARGTVSYTIGKAAMEGIAYVLAKEEVEHGIRVNVVAPGLVATKMGTSVVKGMTGGVGHVTDLDDVAPFGRVCRPNDVANVVAFLVSDAGGYITGERIRVDGGTPGWIRPRRVE